MTALQAERTNFHRPRVARLLGHRSEGARAAWRNRFQNAEVRRAPGSVAGIRPCVMLWIRNFKDNGTLIRPRVNWNAATNVVLAIGADIFSGPTQSVFGRFSNRDHLYGEIRFDF